MKFPLLNLILLLLINYTFGQVTVIVPTKGIEGSGVVLDSTNISDVIKIYGNNYLKSELSLVTYYRYGKLGLTFQIDPYDKNQIIRSIFIEIPFQAKTTNGIVLNESTMNDVYKLYNEKGCFTSGDYAWRPQKGISFYIKRDPNKKGFNPKERIYKIEVHNRDEFGSSSRVNFEFNNEPVEKKLQELISILKADNIDFKQLDRFWEAEQKKEKEPYGLQKRLNFERMIEFVLSQEFIEIRMIRSNYNLNIIKSDGKLVYLKLSNQEGNYIVLERKEMDKINNILKQTEKAIDTSIAINLPLDIYTYGTFCGLHGTPPEKCQVMLGFVKENKYYELANWLYSLNPEIATYGYIGLDFLKRQGKDILQQELRRMAQLSKSNIKLNTCRGCIFGVTEKINDVLRRLNLNRIYLSFQQTGWLK
jgi:hypothetical protein